jgi:site-specific DNA-cytosine methylase
METVVFCEKEAFPQKVLNARFPGIPIIEDVHDFRKERLMADGIISERHSIDIISAGYPCQPFSHAGKRKGENDDRHLWPEVKRVLEEIRPRWFIGENVSGHISTGLDDVLADLEGIGYSAWPVVFPASAVGSQNNRERVFIVCYSSSSGLSECGRPSIPAFSSEKTTGLDVESERPSEAMANTDSNGNCGFEENGVDRERQEKIKEWELTQYRLSNVSQNVADTESERCGKTGRDKRGRFTKRSSGSSADVANTESDYKRGLSIRADEENPGSSLPCENVADTEFLRQQESREFIKSSNSGTNQEGEASRAINGCIGYNGAAEPRLGRVPNEFSDWLDGCGLNPLNALIEIVNQYPQPAPMGMEQYDWEPPRVAEKVPDRVDRLKAIGNAVNPLQIYPILYAIRIIDEWLAAHTTY